MTKNRCSDLAVLCRSCRTLLSLLGETDAHIKNERRRFESLRRTPRHWLILTAVAPAASPPACVGGLLLFGGFVLSCLVALRAHTQSHDYPT